MEKRDITLAEALNYAYRTLRDEDGAQEAVAMAWSRLSRRPSTADYPGRAALRDAIADWRRGRTFAGVRIKHERWESKPRPDVHRLLPLSADDYAGRAGLVCAQEYRLALATDDADVIESMYA